MEQVKYKPPGRWKKGESGNPRGRKPGSDTLSQIRAGISAFLPDVISKLITQALSGDIGAARLLLERSIAPLRAVEMPTELKLPTDGTLVSKANCVLNEAALGVITPAQAGALISAIGTLSKIYETVELEKRIEKLEGQHGNA
jgi:Family of unknown function (DUF5681)